VLDEAPFDVKKVSIKTGWPTDSIANRKHERLFKDGVLGMR
jgi:hypothetical protein